MKNRSVEFFEKPITLVLSVVYYVFSAFTFVITFFGLVDIHGTSEPPEEILLIKTFQYSFSVFLLLCAVVYLLLYIFAKKSEKSFRTALILLKTEASIEIAFDVFLAVVFVILLFVVGFVALATAFIFLPSIIISGLFITIFSIAAGCALAVNLARNITKLLFAGTVRKNLNREKKSATALLYGILNFFSAGLVFVIALLLAVFLYNYENGLGFAVLSAALIPPLVFNGIFAVKYAAY